MRRITCILALSTLFVLHPGSAGALTSRILSSSFAAGAGTSSTPQTVVATSLGEPLAGNTSSSSTTIAGGFLGGGSPGQSGLTLAVQASWNLVSVPLTVGDYARTILFPTATSEAFSYQGGYTAVSILQNARGYWLKFGSAQSVFLAGQSRTFDSVAVLPGWNIIGSISHSVPVANIQSIPPGVVTSSFFGYTSGGYGVTSSIDPGEGYWVKVSAGGTLILTSAQSAPESRITILPTSELPPPPPGSEAAVGAELPTEFALEQNYPNPFNPVTTITFAVPGHASVGTRHAVSLRVFDMLGRPVATLVDDTRAPGVHSVQFDASHLASGTYLYRLTAGGFTATRTMLLLK